MNQTDIHQRAQHLETELKEKGALDSNHSAFAKDLEDARKNMSPQDYAALCKEMQHDINGVKGAGDMRNPEHLPALILEMNKDGTVKKADFKQYEFGGDVSKEVFTDSSCNEVHQETRTHGIENETADIASNVVTPWWTSAVQWVTDHTTADHREYHAHHDEHGHPVH
jgi:hypothetical protein